MLQNDNFNYQILQNNQTKQKQKAGSNESAFFVEIGIIIRF